MQDLLPPTTEPAARAAFMLKTFTDTFERALDKAPQSVDINHLEALVYLLGAYTKDLKEANAMDAEIARDRANDELGDEEEAA